MDRRARSAPVRATVIDHETVDERPTPPGYTLQSLDTDRRAEELQFELWAKLAPHERLAILASTCESMWRAKLRALAQEHPDLDEHGLELLEAEQRLGVDLARRAFEHARRLGLRP